MHIVHTVVFILSLLLLQTLIDISDPSESTQPSIQVCTIVHVGKTKICSLFSSSQYQLVMAFILLRYADVTASSFDLTFFSYVVLFYCNVTVFERNLTT